MAFRVGQKVVCVDNSGLGQAMLSIGQVYTVSNTEGLPKYICVEGVGDWRLGRPGWLASRFRPVVEKKTDISIFTAMLKDARPKVQA